MSTLATDTPLSSATFAGELTATLVPTVTRIDTRLDISPVSVVLAVSIVCILSPITVTGNSIILAAFYRYKRLRTASNCLLVSLAISDFGVSLLLTYNLYHSCINVKSVSRTFVIDVRKEYLTWCARLSFKNF